MRNNHSRELIIGDRSQWIQTRIKIREGTCLIAHFELGTIKFALDNECWVNAMNEDIDQIEKDNT